MIIDNWRMIFTYFVYEDAVAVDSNDGILAILHESVGQDDDSNPGETLVVNIQCVGSSLQLGPHLNIDQSEHSIYKADQSEHSIYTADQSELSILPHLRV